MLGQWVPDPPCELSDCLERIRARASVTVMEPEQQALAGAWSNGGGLSGSNLYLFPDSSYMYTEWADIQEETIYHKGKWRVAGGLVALSPDADVTWQEPGRDTRYLAFRISAAPETLLLGLDFSLVLFERITRDTPSKAATWLRLSSFVRDRQWTPAEADVVRQTLLECCWRPDYFGDYE